MPLRAVVSDGVVDQIAEQLLQEVSDSLDGQVWLHLDLQGYVRRPRLDVFRRQIEQYLEVHRFLVQTEPPGVRPRKQEELADDSLEALDLLEQKGKRLLLVGSLGRILGGLLQIPLQDGKRCLQPTSIFWAAEGADLGFAQSLRSSFRPPPPVRASRQHTRRPAPAGKSEIMTILSSDRMQRRHSNSLS
jgi:hypothetical protein